MVDDPRPGQANIVITADLIDKTDDILATKMDVSVGKVWTIVHDRLRYQKVCAY